MANTNITNFYNSADMSGGIYAEKIKYIIKVIKSHNLTDKNIIDVGCYDGTLAKKIESSVGIKIDGADIADAQIEKCESIKTKYNIDFNESGDFPIEKKYELVVACDVIEHVLDCDDFLEKINRIQPPNGYLIISTPNLGSLARRIMLMLGINPFIEVSKFIGVNGSGLVPVGHIKYFVEGSFDRLLENSGYSIIEKFNTGINLPGGYNSKVLGRIFPSMRWHLLYTCVKR